MAGLRIERDGPILRVTLARPERRNAFDAQLIAELRDAFIDVGASSGSARPSTSRSTRTSRTRCGSSR
jgi:enoyl-CoA hydratase/carnithine racemase